MFLYSLLYLAEIRCLNHESYRLDHLFLCHRLEVKTLLTQAWSPKWRFVLLQLDILHLMLKNVQRLLPSLSFAVCTHRQTATGPKQPGQKTIFSSLEFFSAGSRHLSAALQGLTRGLCPAAVLLWSNCIANESDCGSSTWDERCFDFPAASHWLLFYFLFFPIQRRTCLFPHCFQGFKELTENFNVFVTWPFLGQQFDDFQKINKNKVAFNDQGVY